MSNLTDKYYHASREAHTARICMVTEVGSSRKLELPEDAGEAVLEL
jgi:hypothetical protein